MGKNIYASVKSYSRRGQLLKKSDYQTLAESRDLDELMTRIKNTIYDDAISDVQKPYTSQRIEAALRGHLATMHYSIAKTTEDSKILDAYFIKFIITNLKQVLKGKVLNKPQEEIESHINLRAEELLKQRDIIVKALVAKDLEEAVASLSTSLFGDEIAKAVTLYNERKNIQIFDTYFDKILYQQLGRSLNSTRDMDVVKLVGMDIDFYNLQSIIRGKFWGLDEAQIEDLIVAQTPTITKDVLGKIISTASVRDAFTEISNTRYKSLVPEVTNELDAVTEFERAFEMQLYHAAARSFTKMFSFATIVGITKLTTFEVRNMGTISYAVEQKIPIETCMSKLIIEE